MKPDLHEIHKQHTFDSFCKKVLKHEAAGGHREINRRARMEISMSDLSEEAMEQLAVYDDYPWDYTPFQVGGETVLVKDDRLAEALPVPVLNMPRLTVADAKAAGCTKLGILATDGTLQAETYQIACRDAGIEWAAPAGDHQDDIMSVIYDDIKQGRRADMAKFGGAVHDLKKQGCDMAVLGCTELSLVKRDEHLGKFFIDSTEVLCRHALEACGVTPIGF